MLVHIAAKTRVMKVLTVEQPIISQCRDMATLFQIAVSSS